MKSFMRQVLLALLPLLAFMVSTVTVAQMRQDVPRVLTPPPAQRAPDAELLIKLFSEANIAQGRPRMLVFWNRYLSDEVASRYQSSLTLDSGGSFNQYASASKSVSEYGSDSQVEQEAHFNSRLELAERNQRIDPVARAQLEELNNWEIEGAFKQAMISGGARLIDRNMIIRTTGANAVSNEEVNILALETESMKGKADLLMEVLLAVSYESPTGVAFQTTITDINTGEIITVISTPAEPPATTETYYSATNRGFVRVEETVGDSLADVGRALALETMTALSAAWSH